MSAKSTINKGKINDKMIKANFIIFKIIRKILQQNKAINR